MKATGIVRRVDDLGRVVIPKELRRTLRIREGDPLEIFTEQGGAVIFKKYYPLGEQTELAEGLCQALLRHSGFPAAVCDRDRVIAAAGPGRQELTDRLLAPALLRRLEERERFCPRGQGLPIPLAEGSGTVLGAAVPILAGGDLQHNPKLVEKASHRHAADLKQQHRIQSQGDHAAELIFAEGQHHRDICNCGQQLRRGTEAVDGRSARCQLVHFTELMQRLFHFVHKAPKRGRGQGLFPARLRYSLIFAEQCSAV